MKTTYLTVSAAVIALLVTAPAALALPPVDDDPIPHCPPGYILVDDICVKLPTPPPPPPSNSPAVELNLARQSTDAQAVRMTGRATDADQPATALTVHISVDGVFKRTVVANLADPPVATQGFAAVPPPTSPATARRHRPGAGERAAGLRHGRQRRQHRRQQDDSCKDDRQRRRVQRQHDQLRRRPRADPARRRVPLDQVSHTNNTGRAAEHDGQRQKPSPNTHGWPATAGIKVTVKGSAGIRSCEGRDLGRGLVQLHAERSAHHDRHVRVVAAGARAGEVAVWWRRSVYQDDAQRPLHALRRLHLRGAALLAGAMAARSTA